MNVNFEITDNHALTFEGRHIDLHNCFDFVGFEYDVAERAMKLSWKKSKGNWVDKNELAGLVLAHKAVTYLRVIDEDGHDYYEDGSCLGEITYFPSAERETNDCFMWHSKPNDGDDILYFFESGQKIRIHCEQIELSVFKD